MKQPGQGFPKKTIQRYRRLGLRTVRIGRRVWFRLDDVLRFLDQQQERMASSHRFEGNDFSDDNQAW